MQETPNSDLGKGLISLATIVTLIGFSIGISYYGGIEGFMTALKGFFNFILDLVSFKLNLTIPKGLILSISLFVIGLIVFIAILLICGISIYAPYSLIKHFKDKSEFIKRETIEIEDLLSKESEAEEDKIRTDLGKLREKLIISRAQKKLNCFTKELKKRIEIHLKLLEELKKHRKLEEKQRLTEQVERRNQEAEEQRRINDSYEESDADMICSQLRTWENIVFIKSKLSKNQIKALEKKGYKQTNEYSVKENKFIRVLVKPDSNHTKTHAFLVWDTIRLLKNFKGVKNIQEHETVDADITFNFNKKRYALEIERGDLLRKKKQAQEKVEWLNRKYRKRWMFIVSNKNNLYKYNELGFSTQRKQVLENLKRLLKIV
ncbi:MAG: hypothetical protein AABX17_00020 [Nanoarchaeota archaeon]